MGRWIVIALLSVGVSLADPGDPDLSNPVLEDGEIRYIDGGQVMSILEDWFPDDSLIGHWIAVRRYEDLPIEYYRIVSNKHFDQWNISVFEVEEDLSAGGTEWWYYDEAFIFDIFAPIPEPVDVISITQTSAGFYTILVDEEFNRMVTVMASSDMINWVAIDTVLAEDGVIEFQDPDPDENTCRFYQVVIP